MLRPGPFHEPAAVSSDNDNDNDNDVPHHDDAPSAAAQTTTSRKPMMPARSRSMSDSGGSLLAAAKLSPSPHIVETSMSVSMSKASCSKDDSSIPDIQPPVTPRRPSFASRAPAGLGLQTLALSKQAQPFTPPGPLSSLSSSSSSHACVRPAPLSLSPKPDHSQIYASPTNLLPRRSRGLDFSRAATSLHHSILAEQPSPGSSPLVSGCGWGMSIPSRQGDFVTGNSGGNGNGAPGGGGGGGGPEQSSTSLWSIMGNHEKMNANMNAVNASHPLADARSDISSSSYSSSSDDDLMDEDPDASFVTTPVVPKTTTSSGTTTTHSSGAPFDPSPARSNFPSFSQRQRHHRKVPKNKNKKTRVPSGLGFNLATTAGYSPSNGAAAAAAASRARRESISWQANQLQISSSGGEADEPARRASDADGGGQGDSSSVIRRVVTRRGNLLPKSKNFARIRAALAEECSPAEADFMREAEIVKQVRESDMDLEPRHHPAEQPQQQVQQQQTSPNLLSHESSMEDILHAGEGVLHLGEPDPTALGPLGIANFKHQAIRNSRGNKKFWDTFSESSSMGGARTPPPPPAPPAFPTGLGLGSSSSGAMSEDTTMESPSLSLQSHAIFPPSYPHPHQNQHPPSAAEITRRINSKRRRGEDDLDPGSFKRRAVSPSVSAHGSPIVQSPLQRDSVSLGSRPGSTGGERGGSVQSEGGQGSGGGTPAFPPWGATGQVNRKGRVGMQGMVDTHDGIMRMSIE